MTSFSYHIDWLTVTKKLTFNGAALLTDRRDLITCMLREAHQLGIDTLSHVISAGRRFYDVEITFSSSGIVMSGAMNIMSQGLMVVAKGKSLTQIEHGHWLLSEAVDNGWKPTRIDLALDVFESGVTVADWHDVWVKANSENRQKKTAFISSPSGDTFYIGSRQSEKMLRIYDKAKEQKIHHDWVRLEIELKGEAAVTSTPRILADLNQSAMLIVMALNTPSFELAQDIEQFAHGEEFESVRKVRTKEGQEKWLFGTVASALAKLKVADPDLYRALWDYTEQRAAALKEGYFPTT